MEQSSLIPKSSKAQIWGTDLMVAAVIFSVALSFFYIYSINSFPETEENLRDLNYEGGIISDMILSEGYPVNWNENNVIEIGILSDGKVNETKLERFYNLTITNYSRVKSVFNTANDFYLFFNGNMGFSFGERDGIGKPGFNRSNIISENLVRINRVAIYKNKLDGVTLYIWN